jgi:predicted transposase YdaD
VDESATLQEQLDPVFVTQERRADLIIRYGLPTGISEILHLEFQRSPDADLPLRMAIYALRIRERYGQMARQVLILLEESPAARRIPNVFEEGAARIEYQIARIWEQDPQIILNSERLGLIPLVALMGQPNQITDRLEACASALSARIQSRLARLSCVALVITTRYWKCNWSLYQEQTYGGFNGVSLVAELQKWLNEAEQKGEAEGERQMLIKLLSHKFGSLSETVKEKLATITEPEQLERLMYAAIDVTSLDDFCSYLNWE